MVEPDSGFLRYSRHVLLQEIGQEGQDSIGKGTAVVVGLGGLGSTASALLARAGVGTLRLVDPDRVDWSNLQRQSLYDERDAKRGVLKVQAALEHLRRMNREVSYETVGEAIGGSNAERIVGDATVVVDGLDSFRSRAVLNQACVKMGVPLVHGACVATHGTVTTIIPGETPCYACIVPDAAERESPYTAATSGVFAPAVFAIASLEASEALKILAGRRESSQSGKMLWVDVWSGDMRSFAVGRNPDCPVCGLHRYPLLNSKLDTQGSPT